MNMKRNANATEENLRLGMEGSYQLAVSHHLSLEVDVLVLLFVLF